MPGLAHLYYGLVSGTTLYCASRGRFTPQHMLVYGVSVFFGPDFAPVVEYLFRAIWPTLASGVMDHLHDIAIFPVVLAPLLATLWCTLLSYEIRLDNHLYRHEPASTTADPWWHFPPVTSLRLAHAQPTLSIYQAYILVVAGSLSHWMYEAIFEDGGHSDMFRAIIATGYWRSLPDPVDLWNTTTLILAAGTLIMGFALTFALRPSDHHQVRALYQDNKQHGYSYLRTLKQWVFFLALSMAVYLLMMATRLYIMHKPAMGEEADLGVMIYALCFIFAPQALCVLSMPSVGRLEAENAAVGEVDGEAGVRAGLPR